jgi:CDP-diacylglycerol---glycerol-3-phosphate 3-phosphatidyltransferase
MNLNTPNKLTFLRIILVPFIMFFYLADFLNWGKYVAFGIFILAASTDFLDGYIARKYNCVTTLGKFLDTIADKVLTLTALVLLSCSGTIIAPYGAIVTIIIISRELIVSGLRQVAASKNVIMAADKLGKIKTFSQDISLPILILVAGLSANGIANTFVYVLAILGYVGLAIATLFTIISGINYFVKNKEVLK